MKVIDKYLQFYNNFCQENSNEENFEDYEKNTIRATIINHNGSDYLFIFHHIYSCSDMSIYAYNNDSKEVELVSKIELDVRTSDEVFEKCLIDDLYTTPKYQGQGFARILSDASKQACKNLGVSYLYGPINSTHKMNLRESIPDNYYHYCADNEREKQIITSMQKLGYSPFIYNGDLLIDTTLSQKQDKYSNLPEQLISPELDGKNTFIQNTTQTKTTTNVQ